MINQYTPAGEEVDEVERCRQVRDAIDREFKNVDEYLAYCHASEKLKREDSHSNAKHTTIDPRVSKASLSRRAGQAERGGRAKSYREGTTCETNEVQLARRKRE